MGKDINDAGTSGHTMDELLASARAQGKMSVKGQAAREALAEAGLARLQELVDACGIAQNKEEAIGLVATCMDQAQVVAFAAAHEIHRAKVAGHFLRLRGAKRGLADAATRLQKLVEEQAQEFEDEIASPDSRRLNHLGFPKLEAPAGYTVDKHGVHVQGKDGQTRVCPGPLVISGVARDVSTGFEVLELTWWRRNKPVRHMVDRHRALDARKLVELARAGAPISSASATATVRYLQAFEAMNMDRLTDRTTSSHMGWSNGHFVLPQRSWPEGVELRAEEGVAKVASAIKTKGSWEGWCRVVDQHLTTRPLAMLAIYASACTPLLQVLRAQGFVVDWSGETSLGKTTTLRVAASVWGDPDDNGEGLVLSWASSSDVGPTTVAWFLQSLPVILDDTKRGRPEVVGRIMYDLPAGQARLKGTKDGGLRAPQSWRTCLLSTGEAPITSFKEDGGAVARSLCLRGSPLGGESEGNREAARAIAIGMAENHGWLGPKLLAYLEQADKTDLRKRWRDLEALFADQADSAVAGRLSAYVATMALAAQIVHELGVPRFAEGMDPIDEALTAARSGGENADRAKEALLQLVGWANANQPKFWGRHDRSPRDGEPRMPHDGWAGRWDEKPYPGRPHWLCIRPDIVKRLLADWSYDVASVVDAWQRRGWTVSYTEGASQKVRALFPVRVQGRKTRLLAFDSAMVESLMA